MGILGNGRYDRAHVEESTVRLSKRGGERKKDETETRRAAAVASGACMRVRRSSVMGVGVRRRRHHGSPPHVPASIWES